LARDLAFLHTPHNSRHLPTICSSSFGDTYCAKAGQQSCRNKYQDGPRYDDIAAIRGEPNTDSTVWTWPWWHSTERGSSAGKSLLLQCLQTNLHTSGSFGPSLSLSWVSGSWWLAYHRSDDTLDTREKPFTCGICSKSFARVLVSTFCER
jgi:hypothetical protein